MASSPPHGLLYPYFLDAERFFDACFLTDFTTVFFAEGDNAFLAGTFLPSWRRQVLQQVF